MPLNVTILAVVLLLLPMLYMLLASPAFLLVRLEVPQVAQLLRAMFFGYFLILIVLGLAATTFSLLAGQLFEPIVLGLFTIFVVFWRHWIMSRMDALLSEIQAGAAGAERRLRKLHWMGMGANAVQTALIVALIPSLVVVA